MEVTGIGDVISNEVRDLLLSRHLSLVTRHWIEDLA